MPSLVQKEKAVTVYGKLYQSNDDIPRMIRRADNLLR